MPASFTLSTQLLCFAKTALSSLAKLCCLPPGHLPNFRPNFRPSPRDLTRPSSPSARSFLNVRPLPTLPFFPRDLAKPSSPSARPLGHPSTSTFTDSAFLPATWLTPSSPSPRPLGHPVIHRRLAFVANSAFLSAARPNLAAFRWVISQRSTFVAYSLACPPSRRHLCRPRQDDKLCPPCRRHLCRPRQDDKLSINTLGPVALVSGLRCLLHLSSAPPGCSRGFRAVSPCLPCSVSWN